MSLHEQMDTIHLEIDLLYQRNILIDMDTNQCDNDYVVFLQKNQSKKKFVYFDNLWISFEYLQEFNGSNCEEQINLLAKVNYPEELWTFLSLNATSNSSQTFLEELYQLTLTQSSVKEHLCQFNFSKLLIVVF